MIFFFQSLSLSFSLSLSPSVSLFLPCNINKKHFRKGLNLSSYPTNHVSEIVLIFPCFYLFFPVIPFFDGFALDCPCFFLALLLFAFQFFNFAKYCCFFLAIWIFCLLVLFAKEKEGVFARFCVFFGWKTRRINHGLNGVKILLFFTCLKF